MNKLLTLVVALLLTQPHSVRAYEGFPQPGSLVDVVMTTSQNGELTSRVAAEKMSVLSVLFYKNTDPTPPKGPILDYNVEAGIITLLLDDPSGGRGRVSFALKGSAENVKAIVDGAKGQGALFSLSLRAPDAAATRSNLSVSSKVCSGRGCVFK